MDKKDSKIIKLSKNKSFNESNLMTLPFISLKRKKEYKIERKWVSQGVERGLIVKGTDLGCPTIYELDLLLALFKIHSRNMNNKIELSEDNKVTNIGNTINFTFRELAREMNYKNFGTTVKNRLDKSIKTLVECTLYSTQAIKNQENGEYVSSYKSEESFRILSKYKKYSVKNRLQEKEKLVQGQQVKEHQSVQIDEFFFNNLLNNYLKVFDYDKYMSLKSAVGKKLLLLLTQWSHQSSKYIKIQTLYENLGMDINSLEDAREWNKKLKIAFEELCAIKFIKNYEFDAKKGVKLDFNDTAKKSLKARQYKDEKEILDRLYEIGFSLLDVLDYLKPESLGYLAALLRYVDEQESKGLIKDVYEFTLKGLPLNSYNVSGYEGVS